MSKVTRLQGCKVTRIMFFLVSLLPCFFTFLPPSFAEDKSPVRPKIGLALGGGGSRGAAHIGVLKVLERENIPVDYLVGTSAGALIAALYSGGVCPRELEKYVLSGAISKVYKSDFSLLRGLFIYINRTWRTFIGKPFYAGLYNDHRLHNFVNNAISKSDGTIDLVIPLHVIAVDLISGLPVVIKSGDIGLAVQASTAIPALRQPIVINEQLLVDGAVLKNIPIEEVKKMGANLIIAVDVDTKMETLNKEDFRSFESVLTRAISLGLRAQSESILSKADVVINPDLTGIGILDLDKKSLAKAIKAGEEETIKLIPKIKRKIEEKNYALRTAYQDSSSLSSFSSGMMFLKTIK
ncbi:MAG: patatin-like phospholipase family protein [Candidatus Melainabacteria bacterium]|nr:patatin-like phospholipase family protein [Candidatus Melainabacteria bacterium]